MILIFVGACGAKVRRLESRQIKDYFGKFDGGSSSVPSPSSLSIDTQTELTLNLLADIEGRSQNSSQVTSLQNKVVELEHYLAVCKEKLEATTARLNKCLEVGKELLIEKVTNQ